MLDAPEQEYTSAYEIRVSGSVDPERAIWFGCSALQVARSDDGKVSTFLSVKVPDQAALFGILSRIRDMGLKLISVTQIEQVQLYDATEDLPSEEEL